MLSRKAVLDRVRKVFGGKRAELRKLIIAERDRPANKAQWDMIGERLYSATRQPVQGFKPFLDEGYEHVDDPNYNEFQLGDASAYYDILLNKGLAAGYDWDKRMSLKCGGTARLCGLFVSAVLPVYILDLYYQTYSRKPRYYGFGPIVRPNRRELAMLARVEKVLRSLGYQPLARRLAMTPIPSATTDCRDRGEATLFDCLFSDIYCLEREHVRFNDISDEGYPECLLEATYSWREWYTGKGKLLKRQVDRRFPSGDGDRTILDAEGRITRVEVFTRTPSNWLELDVRGPAAKSHPRGARHSPRSGVK